MGLSLKRQPFLHMCSQKNWKKNEITKKVVGEILRSFFICLQGSGEIFTSVSKQNCSRIFSPPSSPR